MPSFSPRMVPYPICFFIWFFSACYPDTLLWSHFPYKLIPDCFPFNCNPFSHLSFWVSHPWLFLRSRYFFLKYISLTPQNRVLTLQYSSLPPSQVFLSILLSSNFPFKFLFCCRGCLMFFSQSFLPTWGWPDFMIWRKNSKCYGIRGWIVIWVFIKTCLPSPVWVDRKVNTFLNKQQTVQFP